MWSENHVECVMNVDSPTVEAAFEMTAVSDNCSVLPYPDWRTVADDLGVLADQSGQGWDP